ncbi:hypothetical protein F2Q69_00027337, partial [Brassica cretica]
FNFIENVLCLLVWVNIALLLKYIVIIGFITSLVESVGEHVDGFKQGDVVLPVFHPNCEECKDCKSSKSNWCARYANDSISNTRRYGMASRFKDSTGEDIHHFLFVSSFSEYTVVDIAHLVKISPDIPVQKAALLSCGVSTGVGAAWKVANVEEGSTVAVFGLGAVGLAAAEGARLRGAAKIIGVDLNPDKFELGKKFGFTDFVNPTLCGEKKVSEVIKEMTGGGVDYSFECVGLPSILSEAFISTRTGSGKTVMLGMGKHAAPISLGSFDLLSGRTICGSLFGGLKSKLDIPVLVDHYLKKVLHDMHQTIYQYHLEKEVKPVEVAPEITTTTQEVEAKEESPAEEAVEDKSKSPEVTSEEAPAATEEAPANEENTSEEVAEETPDEIKLETAPADFRFPTTNQTRHCFTRYIEYHRCVAAKGDEAPECDKFSKFYRSLCPGEWVDRWNEQRENGTFPGPL